MIIGYQDTQDLRRLGFDDGGESKAEFIDLCEDMGIDREPSNSWDPQGNTAVGICNSTRLPCHHTVAKHIIPWRGPYFLPVPVTT